MKNNVKLITVSAVTVALTAVLGLLPYVFLVPLLFTCVTRDWKMTVFESLCFGVISLAYSFISPTVVGATFIANPWIPIVPRLLTGLGCHGVYVLLRKACKGNGRASVFVPVVIACAVGSLLNTGLVVPCLIWRGGNLFWAIIVETLIAACIEFAVAIFVVPPVAVTVGKTLRLRGYVSVKKPDVSVEFDNVAEDNANVGNATAVDVDGIDKITEVK